MLAAEGGPRLSVARIADILRGTSMVLDEVRVFASAKVPILKFISRHGKFSVDVTVNASNGVAAAAIIKDFVRDIPAVKPLSLIVKYFLRSKDANEVYKGGLSSYLVVCMVIFFLQVRCDSIAYGTPAHGISDARRNTRFALRSFGTLGQSVSGLSLAFWS